MIKVYQFLEHFIERILWLDLFSVRNGKPVHVESGRRRATTVWLLRSTILAIWLLMQRLAVAVE